MLKPSEKSKLVDQDALIEKIKEGYTVNRVSKHVQKKTFAPSTIAYGFGECAESLAERADREGRDPLPAVRAGRVA